MKLRLTKQLTDDIRKLSAVYDIPMSKIAKKAELAMCRGLRYKDSPTCNAGGTTIDVSDTFTAEEWRGGLSAYCVRELATIDAVFDRQILEARRNAETERASLPRVMIEN